jgi:UDP-N-acetylmuramate dehydrogenase
LHEANLVLDYEPLRQRLSNCENISPQLIAQLVKQIRDEKLPSPDQLPNVGSFFKNPMVSRQRFSELQQRFPTIVGFSAKGDCVKLAAGWLIEQSGWKGYRLNGVGVHQNQALVLINYEQKSGVEILALATKIQLSIKQHFKIDLEIEPSVL